VANYNSHGKVLCSTNCITCCYGGRIYRYNLEDWLSDKHTPSRKSAIERREDRRANEGEAEYKVPKTIFERNVSPGLERKD